MYMENDKKKQKEKNAGIFRKIFRSIDKKLKEKSEEPVCSCEKDGKGGESCS